MPDDVLRADKGTQDRWIFGAAAYWPDVARGTEYDRPWWHFINLPLFVDPSDEAIRFNLPFNQSIHYPAPGPLENMNVVQAIGYAKAVIRNDTAGVPDKALAYCWLFHLVGDIHQPLHAVSLVSVKQFPDGDRGGNRIPLTRGRNLHALWDGLLGTDGRPRSIDREVTRLSDPKIYGNVWASAPKELSARMWAAESNELCKSAVYTPEILNAVRRTPAGIEMAPVSPSETYLRNAGHIARQRVIAAGLRLGAVLKVGD